MTEQLQEEQIEMKRDLLRLQAIMDSYIEAEEDRSEAGGGTAQALTLRKAEESHLGIRVLHQKMKAYRDMRDQRDDEMRERARGHIAEIDRLEGTVRDLEHQLEYALRRGKRENESRGGRGRCKILREKDDENEQQQGDRC